MRHTLSDLRQMQGLPLELKIIATQNRIRQWHDYWRGNIHVAFSGGIDSTVLLHITRDMYKNIPAVFSDTGLEFPEIRSFVKSFDNVITLRPKMSFDKVLEKYGYPVISKNVSRSIRDLQNASDKNKAVCNLRLTGFTRKGTYCPSYKLPKRYLYLVNAPFKISEQCCEVLKKNPFKIYEKETGSKPLVGIMAVDSGTRERQYLRNGCNAFHFSSPMSMPLSFWTEEDIWEYIKQFSIPYCEVYDKGEKHTGCIFCMFGAHLEGQPNRFQRLSITHPKHFHYCIESLGLGRILDYINVPYTLKEE